MEHYRHAVAMVTAPEAFLELTTIEQGGHSLKAYKHAPGSMRDLWMLGQGYADQEYIVYGNERWTFAEAGQIVANFASWLQTQGVGSGDRVAIALRNYPEWIFAYWGVIAVGGVVVGMNAWWVADEMAYALKDSEPKILVADDQRLAVFSDIAADFADMTVVAVREPAPPVEAIQWADTVTGAAELPMPPIEPNDDACIFYTSGTTGRPKGAQLTHRGCVHNIMNVAAMGQIFATTQALGRGETVEAPVSAPPATSLVATPLFHVTANNCVMHGATLSGGKLVLMYKWDTEEALGCRGRRGDRYRRASAPSRPVRHRISPPGARSRPCATGPRYRRSYHGQSWIRSGPDRRGGRKRGRKRGRQVRAKTQQKPCAVLSVEGWLPPLPKKVDPADL